MYVPLVAIRVARISFCNHDLTLRCTTQFLRKAPLRALLKFLAMTERNNAKSWRLSDLNSLTRAIIAAFSGQIGDEPQQLGGNAFIDSMMESFAGMTREDVVKEVGYFGLQGVRNSIINRLGPIKEDASSAVVLIGRLAGDSEGITALSRQVAEQIRRDPSYEIIPSLQVLSELAINNLGPPAP